MAFPCMAYMEGVKRNLSAAAIFLAALANRLRASLSQIRCGVAHGVCDARNPSVRAAVKAGASEIKNPAKLREPGGEGKGLWPALSPLGGVSAGVVGCDGLQIGASGIETTAELPNPRYARRKAGA